MTELDVSSYPLPKASGHLLGAAYVPGLSAPGVSLPHTLPSSCPSEERLMCPPCSDYRGLAGQHGAWLPTPQALLVPEWETAVCPFPPPLCLGRLHKIHSVLQARSQLSQFSSLRSMLCLVLNHIGRTAAVGQGHPLEHSLVSSPALMDPRPHCVFLEAFRLDGKYLLRSGAHSTGQYVESMHKPGMMEAKNLGQYFRHHLHLGA